MNPSARAEMYAGTLYAICGEAGWVYYGQVTPDQRIGFFRRRDQAPAEPADVLASPVMAVVGVVHPSIGRALRSGAWRKLGRFDLVEALRELWPLVRWPVGTLIVGVTAEGRDFDTRVEDPVIQDMEVVAGWDAEAHIPQRLTADFGEEEAKWDVGGPVWRERRVREETARRFPDAPWHELPPDWVRTGDR